LQHVLFLAFIFATLTLVFILRRQQ